MKRIFFLLIIILLLVLPGCAKKVDLGPGYEKISKRFLQAMRWQDYQGASGYLEEKDRQQLLDSFEDLKDLHIVEADYRYSRMDEEEGTAESELILKYYMLPSTQIKDWSWKVDWVLIPADSKQRGTWQVQGEPPTFP